MKNNNKGFTLIELLAVIVVLAIIIIIVSVNVLSILNTSKENTFKIYAERVLTKSEEALLEKTIDKNNSQGKYPISHFGFKNTGKYTGCVVVDSSNKPILYLTDGYYSYKGVSFSDVEKNHSTHLYTTASDVQAVNDYCES